MWKWYLHSFFKGDFKKDVKGYSTRDFKEDLKGKIERDFKTKRITKSSEL